jgi:hypothetical protein
MWCGAGDAEYDQLFGDAEESEELKGMRREVQVILDRWEENRGIHLHTCTHASVQQQKQLVV